MQYDKSCRMERRRSQKSQLRANVSEQSVVLDSGARVPESEVGCCSLYCRHCLMSENKFVLEYYQKVDIVNFQCVKK